MPDSPNPPDLSPESTPPKSTELEPESVEALGYGFTRYTLYEGRILILEFPDSVSMNAVDVMAGALDAAMTLHDPARPYLALYYIPNISRLAITPYARRRIMEVSRNHTAIAGRTATVIPQSALYHLVRLLLLQTNQQQPDLHQRLFSDKTLALAWLAELLDE